MFRWNYSNLWVGQCLSAHEGNRIFGWRIAARKIMNQSITLLAEIDYFFANGLQFTAITNVS